MMNVVYCERWLRLLYEHISPNFYRAEPRRRAWTYLCSLVATSDESSRRHLATYPGERRADGAQRLLTSAQWDEQQVKQDLLGLIKTWFGSHGGKLCVTEMAFRKKGTHAAGVERQFSTDTARCENCQVGIMVFYEAPEGSLLLLDCDLYIPRGWFCDPARRARADMPAGLFYRSKTAIAMDLIGRVIAAGILPDWVVLSFQCPDKSTAQQGLKQHGVPHVMTISPSEFRLHGQSAGHQTRSVLKESRVAPRSGRGRPTQLRLRRMTPAASSAHGFAVSYLIRGVGRSASYYYAYSSAELTRRALPEVVANLKQLELRCWRTREDVGIECYEVRSWRGWHRHMTLAMTAYTAHVAHEVAQREERKAE